MSRGTKALELWCRRQIEGYPVEIHNMTTSWKNGMAFCALVHHFRPDLIDFDKLNKADVYYNNDLAFRLAEKHLGIPALLDASDMAMYEVPDRLSILTYLSQYYQRFASQESKIIQDKSATISSATPPPQKMAQIVGVPKREPCKQCGNPVFFAERLTIDGSFYHRKCLRCARCDSQLTPGSFYETEIDGVFCCETCPDEETKLNNNNVKNITDTSPKIPQSFSDKLAMFQTNGKGLLQKSLSDEEKSKSLKRLSELYSKNAPHETTDIKNTKINESEDIQLDKVKQVTDLDDDVESLASESENEEDKVEKVPPPPKTLPPSTNATSTETPTKPKLPPIPSKVNVLNKIYGKMDMPRPINVKLKANATTSLAHQTHTNTEPSVVNNEQSSQIERRDNRANEPNLLETPNAPKTDEKVKLIEINLNKNNNLPLDALNSSTNVTKENAESIEAKQHNANMQHRLEDKRDSINIDNDDDNDNDDNLNVQQGTDRENVTELQPFDLLLDNRSTNDENEEANREKEKEQQQCIDDNDCNESKSTDMHIDKCDTTNTTNQTDNIADLREKSSSISDNDSQKMVRSRLSQFEALVQTSKHTEIALHSPRLNPISTNVENVAEQLEQKCSIEDEDNNGTNTIEPSTQSRMELETHLPVNRISLNADSDAVAAIDTTSAVASVVADDDDIDDKKNVNSNANNSSDSEQVLLNASESNDSDLKKPVPTQRTAINVCLDENASNSPTENSTPVPSKRKQKPAVKLVEEHHVIEENSNHLNIEPIATPRKCSLSSEDNDGKKNATKYPDGLNPFGSDDEDDNNEQNDKFESTTKQKSDLNPFDSSDDEIELMKEQAPKKTPTHHSYRISTNPFGSDSENEEDADSISSKRTPVPTPRKQLNGSLQTTPDISPRMSHTLNPKMRQRAGDDLCGSNASLASTSNYYRASNTLSRSNLVHGSMSSLASSSPRHKKGRAPDIPTKSSVSANSSPSHSIRATPKSKKKRAAPLPPKNPSLRVDTVASLHYLRTPSKLNDSLSSRHTISTDSVVDLDHSLSFATSSESNYVSSSNELSMSSTEPTSHIVAVEQKTSELSSENVSLESTPTTQPILRESTIAQRKLIPLDESLLDDLASKNMTDTDEIVYRRKIMPDHMVTQIKNDSHELITDRQCEKMKENKESQNKNRQSQIVVNDESSQVFSPNKSSYGKWKRRKGPAPSLPIPTRKVIQMLPLQEIRHELEVIEVQQQGLEKQGIMLEKMIRERCEGAENENVPLSECKPNSKEVEDLILQLFELVNEKNELFRRQAELMYLRRQHRLEQEQADIEYEIRVLMAQPECNKTDTDKSREEALISRLVEVVQLRNEVIESLEMDRKREAEEDQSIKERLELHTAKRDEELCQQTPIKLSKKEKKKQKESKKLVKQKKMDADKDADESEINHTDKSKEKKKKKKFLF